MKRRRVDVKGHERERRGRVHAVRPYSQMREARAEEPPSLQALRRHPVPVEPHGAFEVALVDDAGNLRNNIYEIREVGTRRKIAMTGEEIMNLRQSLYPFHGEGPDRFRAAYDEAIKDAARQDLGQLEGDQLIAFMGNRLPGVSTQEIVRWLDEHEMDDQKPKPTIQTVEGELAFVTEVDDIDEAQALLDYQRRHGRAAAATHYNGKHQIYANGRGGRVGT